MELYCLNDNCRCNKNNECQNVYLYVDCFRFEKWEADNFIEMYLIENVKNLKEGK